MSEYDYSQLLANKTDSYGTKIYANSPDTFEAFDKEFQKFLPIVYKASKHYRLHLWEIGDYVQEGMILYHNLRQKGYATEALPVYFKVQFTQHLINLLRRQKAFKRGYDEGNYVELETISNHVADESYVIDSQVLVSDTMATFIRQLKKNDQQLLLKLVDGKEISRVQKHRLKQKLIQFLGEDGNC